MAKNDKDKTIEKKTNIKDEKIKTLKQKSNENSSVHNASFNLIEVIIIVLITACIVGIGSGIIVYKNYEKLDTKYTNKTPSTPLEELIKTYNNIVNSYVDKIDEKGLASAAIESMFGYLKDPYTDYLDKEASANLQDKLKGEYKGIGIEIITTKENTIKINKVFKNSPAENSGLKENDQIIKVDGESMEGKTATDVSLAIKDTDKNNVTLDIKRLNEELTIKVTLQNVEIPVIKQENFNGVGYINIETFSSPSYNQFKNAFASLEKENIKSLIIDVRGNSGGYLSSAFKMADLFIDKGKTIYKLEYKDGKIEDHKAEDFSKKTLPIIILINNGSASSSEILASALRDSYGAKLLGTKSYGKGSIQETEKLSSGAMVKITTAHWLTPNNICIEGNGLKPDIEVEQKSIQNYTYEADTQLQKALQELK